MLQKILIILSIILLIVTMLIYSCSKSKIEHLERQDIINQVNIDSKDKTIKELNKRNEIIIKNLQEKQNINQKEVVIDDKNIIFNLNKIFT